MINLLLIFAFTANASTDYDFTSNETNYKIKGKWQDAPTIVICENESPYSVKQVKEALSFWKNHSITDVIVSKSCDYEYSKGNIKLVGGKYIDIVNHYAETRVLYDRITYSDGSVDKKITSVLIQSDQTTDDVEILIHEMGHALGYLHTNDKNDIMNANHMSH